MREGTDHIQLVWDRGGAGTAQGESGCSLSVGPGGEWTPEQLLVAATESSLMTMFLGLADRAGLGVLGYVSSAGAAFDPDTPARMSLVVRPCIVIGREEDRELVEGLLDKAVEVSPVAQALRHALRIDAEVIAVAPSVVTN
jgi:organic hydroperoxide reductase OsmC/OhrA